MLVRIRITVQPCSVYIEHGGQCANQDKDNSAKGLYYCMSTKATSNRIVKKQKKNNTRLN